MQGQMKLLALALAIVLCAVSLVKAQLTAPRECPPNESYLACGPNCQTECATLNEPCLIQYIRCPDGCYCNEGYARNAERVCIPIKECPKRGRGKHGGDGNDSGRGSGKGKGSGCIY